MDGVSLTHVILRGRIVELHQVSKRVNCATSGWFKGAHHDKMRSCAVGRAILGTRSGYFANLQKEELWRSGHLATVHSVGVLGQFEMANVTRTSVPFLAARLKAVRADPD